jgi:NADH dehydrogenase/NADH:ubiquinone oxidoreductase subunit G
VGKAVKKFTPAQRDAIYRLHKQGKSGTKIAEATAAGTGDLAPFTVSSQYAREIARQVAAERHELYDTSITDLPSSEAVRHLVRRCVDIAERETSRLEHAQNRGRLEAKQLGALAQALERLDKIAAKVDAESSAKAAANVKKPDSAEDSSRDSEPAPTGFAAQLLERDAEAVPDAPTEPEPPAPTVGDVVVGQHGGSFARRDRRPGVAQDRAVPSDHPSTGDDDGSTGASEQHDGAVEDGQGDGAALRSPQSAPSNPPQTTTTPPLAPIP